MTTYLPAWIRSGFKTASSTSKSRGAPSMVSSATARQPIKNADMIKHLLVLLRRRGPGSGVRFKYVPGHTGLEGNEAADVSHLKLTIRVMLMRVRISA